jgi:hypothetical protein
MSYASRARRQFLFNRMEELNAKYGPLPDEPLPDWLDHLVTGDGEATGSLASGPAADETPTGPSARTRVLRASEALQKLDQYGESPVYECEVCGEESAKASVPLGVWHCTVCGQWGRVAPPRRGADW